MGNIIEVDFNRGVVVNDDSTINIDTVIKNRRKLELGLIQPAETCVEIESVEEHASDPIKSLDDIDRISKYFISKKKYRDNMMFIVGINFGLRISDLIRLRFSDLITPNFTFKTTFPILERKTKNTRKNKKNRYITINDAVVDAITLYLQNNTRKLDDFMFRSESNNGCGANVPMKRQSADTVFRSMAAELAIDCKVATHTLRKTFGYHQMVMSGNDPRKLLLLQKMFGHSSAAQTLDYIGITSEEIEDAYMKLNLGGKSNYLVASKIYESNTAS